MEGERELQSLRADGKSLQSFPKMPVWILEYIWAHKMMDLQEGWENVFSCIFSFFHCCVQLLCWFASVSLQTAVNVKQLILNIYIYT